jgi:predicted lipid-binding transport protein (Tim44 family)
VLVVVLLGMVAGFLALRLYAVLGKRTGHEQPLVRPAEERVGVQPAPRTIDVQPEPRDVSQRHVEPAAETGLRAIVASDPTFDVGEFLEGAKSAYGMILDAFWKGDRQTIDWLTDAEVKAAFTSEIEARDAAGHTLENRLVSIERAVIADAAIAGGVARITVRFDADIAAVTRDAEGQVIAGSLTDAVETHDVWTFARTLKSGDPNWKLSDTDEA